MSRNELLRNEFIERFKGLQKRLVGIQAKHRSSENIDNLIKDWDRDLFSLAGEITNASDSTSLEDFGSYIESKQVARGKQTQVYVKIDGMWEVLVPQKEIKSVSPFSDKPLN